MTLTDGGAPSRPARRLDAEGLAALEEERDQLARSLRDLEAEFAAGDLSPEDYTTLQDDYVVRTAAVLRAIEARQSPSAAHPTRRGPRRLLVGAAVVAFAVGAGLLVARLAGTRTSGETITGDIRASTRQELATCLELAGTALRGSASGGAGSDGAAAGAAASQELLAAVKCYSEVLSRAPGNAEALTYRGWLLVRTGNAQLQQQAADDLDAAVASDPAYADARAFRAIVFYRLGQLDAARAEIAVLDTLEAPPIIDSLLDQFGVREGLAQPGQ